MNELSNWDSLGQIFPESQEAPMEFFELPLSWGPTLLGTSTTVGYVFSALRLLCATSSLSCSSNHLSLRETSPLLCRETKTGTRVAAQLLPTAVPMLLPNTRCNQRRRQHINTFSRRSNSHAFLRTLAAIQLLPYILTFPSISPLNCSVQNCRNHFSKVQNVKCGV